MTLQLQGRGFVTQNLRRPVLATRDDSGSIWTEANAVHPTLMIQVIFKGSAGFSVPDHHPPVVKIFQMASGPRDDPGSIRTETNAPHPTLMPAYIEKQGAGF